MIFNNIETTIMMGQITQNIKTLICVYDMLIFSPQYNNHCTHRLNMFLGNGVV